MTGANMFASALGIGVSTDTRTFYFDQATFREVKRFLHTNPSAVNCHNLLERFVVRSLVLKGAKRIFSDYIKQFYIPFFRNVLEMMLAAGWCPYVIRKVTFHNRQTGKRERILAPIVIPVDHCKWFLEANTRTHEFKMHCESHDSTRRVPGVRYISLRDMGALANNFVMHSPLIALLNEFRYVESIKRFTIQAEFVRSNPTVYLERAKDAGGELSAVNQATFPGGIAPGADPNGAAMTPARAVNNAGYEDADLPTRVANFERASTDMLSNVNFHNDQMQDFADHQNSTYHQLGLNYLPQYMNSLYVIPPGMTLAAKPDVPQSRVDQISLERNLSSKIMQAIGIPEAIFGANFGGRNGNAHAGVTTSASVGPTSSSHAHQNIMHINNFEATLDFYRDAFRDAFLTIYEVIFRVSLAEDKVTFEPPDLYGDYLELLASDMSPLVRQHSQVQSQSQSQSQNQSQSQSQSNTDDPQDASEQKSQQDNKPKTKNTGEGSINDKSEDKPKAKAKAKAKTKAKANVDNDNDNDNDNDSDSDSGEDKKKNKKTTNKKRKRVGQSSENSNTKKNKRA